MAKRRTEGSETWHRLLAWDRGQPPAERLTAHLLREEGFNSIDPSHPLGGRDGLKDFICERNGKKWIGAAYFPRGQKTFNEIVTKLIADLEGVTSNNVNGIVFVTNQELKLSERQKLKDHINEGVEIDIFHLERISSILNRPCCYGIRLDFLDIEMTLEEQVSFMAEVYGQISDLKLEREVMLSLISKSESLTTEFHAAFKTIDKNENSLNSKIVNAVPLRSRKESLSSIFGMGKDHNKCSQCGFGFLFNIPYNIFPLPSSVAIKCPKCENVDKILI